MKKETEEIILCPRCKGSGKENIQSSAYDDSEIECPDCKGSGRLIVKTIVETIAFPKE